MCPLHSVIIWHACRSCNGGCSPGDITLTTVARVPGGAATLAAGCCPTRRGGHGGWAGAGRVTRLATDVALHVGAVASPVPSSSTPVRRFHGRLMRLDECAVSSGPGPGNCCRGCSAAKCAVQHRNYAARTVCSHLLQTMSCMPPPRAIKLILAISHPCGSKLLPSVIAAWYRTLST